MKSIVLCCLLLAACPLLQAADHALLIGVSDYPHLPRRLWLRAPVNDVALMREVLIERGFADERIRRLVSRGGGDGGGGGGHEPTRSNILAAMHALLAQVQRGDRVVLYLAGHGSQQPQPAARGQRPAEPDGLDEVFLPADVQRWEGGAGAAAAIPNALLDDEIGEWIDALVDRGAAVWAVFDTCHAAGMARAPSGAAGRVRAVSPAELGLRPGATVRPEAGAHVANAAQRPRPGRTDGRALAFAARTHESTAEEWLPVGARMGQNRLHGVFTYHLAQALRGAEDLGLESLERSVRLAYAREKRAAPTPLFQGDPALRLR